MQQHRKIYIHLSIYINRLSASEEQIEALVAYMENHSGFAASKFMGVNGKEQKVNQWKRITEILNTLGQPKVPKSWKAVRI